MSTALAKRLSTLFRLHDDLAATLEREQLSSKLGDLRSNTMGQQLQCVIGVREMAVVTIRTGERPGFNPSLHDTQDPQQVRAKLRDTAAEVKSVLGDDVADEHEDLVLKLLEHESGHAGQLLRYVLGLSLEAPPRWQRYFDV